MSTEPLVRQLESRFQLAAKPRWLISSGIGLCNPTTKWSIWRSHRCPKGIHWIEGGNWRHIRGTSHSSGTGGDSLTFADVERPDPRSPSRTAWAQEIKEAPIAPTRAGAHLLREGALFLLSCRRTDPPENSESKRFRESALRGILAAGGNIFRRLATGAVRSRVGDEASGTRVLEDLYGEMADKPVTTALICQICGDSWEFNDLRTATFLSSMTPHWLRCASLLPPVQIYDKSPVSRSVLR